MRITYDKEADALYILFSEGPVTTRELADGIAADFDAAGHLAGIEILDVATRLDESILLEEVVLENLASAANVNPAV
jgi:uncharacterized protein YuzE